MPEQLADYLRKRAARSLRYLREQAQGVTSEQALSYADANWPDQKWGIGQNGSIAGIVYHVTAWKQLTLPLFQPDGKAGGRRDFDVSAAPAPDDWPAIVVWLEQTGALWLERLNQLPDEDFDAKREWEGMTIPLAEYVSEMLEHDIQHAAQIEYLRQRLQAQRNV